MTLNPSWADMVAAAKSTPEKVTLELKIVQYQAEPYAAFVALVERALDFSFQQMARDKNNLQKLKEDTLTTVLLGPLKGMAFDATHDKNVGGHCDVSIEGPDEMLWLGEAKIYKAYTTLLEGFRQLTNRYATGVRTQSEGGMIIYCYDANVQRIMDNWKAYILEAVPGLSVESIDGRELEFRSSIPHAASGQPQVFRHTPVLLYHEPTDDLPAPKRTRRS